MFGNFAYIAGCNIAEIRLSALNEDQAIIACMLLSLRL